MTLQEAIYEVTNGHATRIAVPGQFKVWREGESVKFDELDRSERHAANAGIESK